MTGPVDSWGRLIRVKQASISVRPHDDIDLDTAQEKSKNNQFLPHGMGRSYGDTCLNEGGLLLQMTPRDNLISFDRETGLLKAEAGLTIDKLLTITVPAGWFIPVTPGSKFVTLGGAIANDVHGKNHHNSGSFGAHITRFALKRSDKKTVVCSATKNIKYFNMTLGGLGLTGVILWVEIQLKPIKSAYLDVENIRYDSLNEFFKLSRESEDWPYTVAWVDCFAPKPKQGRGIFTRARFTDYGGLDVHDSDTTKTWPFSTPAFFLNRLSISTFNWLYRHRPGAKYKGRMHYDPFFYPLDGINNWNKLYGKKGFYQHQSLIPMDQAKAGMQALLDEIKSAGQGSFLAVMKVHGTETSPAKLGFTQIGAGVSLALDFANKGPKTRTLLDKLDACVLNHNGRTYPAKDGRMSAEFYQACYPDWNKLETLRDPAISSSFWRRVSKA